MFNPIISKDHFVACIKVMQDADEMAVQINKIVDEYKRGDWINGYAFSDDQCATKLVETLELAMGDTKHWISWWIYETYYGKYIRAGIVVNEKNVKIASAEELYDFLVQFYK